MTLDSRSTGCTGRLGRAGGAITLGLFLLSCLIAAPLLIRTLRQTESRVPDNYRFANSEEAPAGDEPSRIDIKEWHAVEGIAGSLAQFETVFWEPDDTTSMRRWIEESGEIEGSRVLEIGTGTGLIAIACAEQEAESVVATDINPAAVANARYNADRLGWEAHIEVRAVLAAQPGPFAVVGAEERFDVILSNPPWENAPVEEPAAYALYDPGFQLLDALLAESRDHLKPGGRLMLAYGARAAIERIERTAPDHGWQVRRIDHRDLDELPEVFLPGMLLELVPAP